MFKCNVNVILKEPHVISGIKKPMGGEEAREMKRQKRERVLEIKACEREMNGVE
jgi:hypothetical protein